ncbi:hypothetical protein KCP71_12325 [Salmonella enterica subsp. enterica]|nr:hypothetical protein KCP71_12325 [Salmonella enterica subsp. enterica]
MRVPAKLSAFHGDNHELPALSFPLIRHSLSFGSGNSVTPLTPTAKMPGLVRRYRIKAVSSGGLAHAFAHIHRRSSAGNRQNRWPVRAAMQKNSSPLHTITFTFFLPPMPGTQIRPMGTHLRLRRFQRSNPPFPASLRALMNRVFTPRP